METPFWHKSKTTLYTSLLLSLSMALAGCMGEDSKARSNSSDTIVVNKIADITNESKDNYDDNVNGLITHKTLKKWIDNWEANRPAGISGKLVILQQGKGPEGAEFIKPNDKNVFTYVESGWLEARDNGVMNIAQIVLSGQSVDRLIRKYGIDVNNDMIVCAQGSAVTKNAGGKDVFPTGAYMNQGRCWFTFSYWGVPQQRIALLNGNNTYLSDSAQLGSTYFSPTASPIISRQISSVKDLKVDNTILYASIEDVINVLPLVDAANSGNGSMLWDARSLPQYSAGQFKWDNELIVADPNAGKVVQDSRGNDYVNGFQNDAARQSHPRGALNLEFTNLLDVGTGLYHEKAKLSYMVRGGLSPKGEGFISGGIIGDYQLAGFNNAYQPGDVIYHYCETSMRAGVTIIAAAVVLGIPSRLYDSAMIEWNSLTSGVKDKSDKVILPVGSPWDTEQLSAPVGKYGEVDGGNYVAPRSAAGYVAEAKDADPSSEITTTEILEGLSKAPLITNAFAEHANKIPTEDKAYKQPKKVVEDDDNSAGNSVIVPPNACGG